MKKRVISVFMVLILCFSFPIVSSAAYDPLDFFVEHLELTFEQISTLLNSDGKHGPSKDHLKSSSSHRSNFDKSSSSGDFVNALTYTFSGNNGDVTFSREYIINEFYKKKQIDVSGYKWFTVYANDRAGDHICTFFFPQNTNCKLHMTRSDFENHTFNRYANPYSYLTDWEPVYRAYCYGPGFSMLCTDYSISSWSEEKNLRDLVGSGARDPLYIMYNDLQSEFIDGDDSSLYHWESQITQIGNDVRTTIACILDDPDSRDKVDISGYSCGSGIVYHDPENNLDGYPSADYFFFDSISTAHYPEPNVIFKQTYNFNLKDFEQFRKRKRLDSLDNFYIYTNVIDDNYECIHYRQQLIDWSSIDDGIFSDVEDLPPYEPPEPSSSPSFNYSPTNNYYTYNTENIENYDFSQHGDDFSSFFHWFNGAFGTFNANFNGLIDAFNGNLKLFSDNMMNFNVELGNYLGALVDKIDVDFTNEINAFGDYFGVIMDLINHNVTVIIDNISANIELMFKPDEDYLDYVLLECCPWYYQVRDVISDVKNNMSESDSVSVHIQIPPLDYDENVEFKDDDTAALFRRTLSVILVAGTVLGCVRLGFQIFGINIRDGQGVE